MYFGFIDRKIDRERAIQRQGYKRKSYWQGTQFSMKMEDDLIVAVLSEHAQARFKERMLAEAEEGIEMIQGVMTDEVQSAIIDNVRIGIPFVLNYEGLILVLHWADCLTILTCYRKAKDNPFYTSDPLLWMKDGNITFYPDGISIEKS